MPAASSTASAGDEAAGIGTVYAESGAYQPGANAVLAYRYRAGGDLQPLHIEEFPTGGSGGFDLTNTGALDSDGQVVLSRDGALLFAVNQGSDSIAVFHVLSGGGLVAVAGSPFPSDGKAPAGLGLSGNRLVVVNKAQDGVRNLVGVAPDVTSFLIQRSGALRPTGSVIPLPTGSSPTEALVSPDGKVVVVPEEHGPFLSLLLSAQGVLTPAPGSPFALPASVFPAGFPPAEEWALGLGSQPGGGVLYAQIVDTAQLAVFQYDDSGRLRFVRAVADPGAYLPCWSALNAAGTRLYTDNAGNNTMSVFDLSDPLNPRQLQVVTLKNGGNPWDLHLDPTGRFIFVLDPRDRQDLVTPGSGNELHTLVVNADGTLTEAAYSPVPIPVPLNTNPIGLAVSGH
jgi:DNA-binding beta-propeller fold protein YncE